MKTAAKFVSSLDDLQTQSLKNIIKNDKSARARMRAHAILLSSKGFSIDDIAFIIDAHRESVSSWIDRWNKHKIKGLYDRPRSGKPPKLTDTEIKTVIELIKENPHSPKIILAKILKKTGKAISMSTLKRIAESAKLRWKRVRKSLTKKRNEKDFDEAQEEIKKLKKQQLKGDIDLVYFDEVGFCLEPSVPYACLPIGETLEIPSSKSNRLNVSGFYNVEENDLVPFCFECSADTSVAAACFDEFSKTVTDNTVVILDNSPIHHSEEFQDNIPKWEEKGIILKYLPAYSPELNLIEILWRFIKYHQIPFSAYTTFKNLVDAVEDILRNIGREYKICFA